MMLSQGYDRGIIRILYGYGWERHPIAMVGKDTLLQLVGMASHLAFGGGVPYWHCWKGYPIAIWLARHPIGILVSRNIIRIAYALSYGYYQDTIRIL